MKEKNFKRLRESFSISINAPVQKIFPLACPEEELKWISGWDYRMVYSDSGKNENNCVFSETITARHIMGSENSEDTYWITTLYDPQEHRIHFVIMRSSTVTKLEITMNEINDHETVVAWDMTATAIKNEADPLFDASMKERMKLMMKLIGHSLKHYCETGEMLILTVS